MSVTLSFYPMEEEYGSSHIQQSVYDRILVNEPLPTGIRELDTYDVSTFKTREEYTRYAMDILVFISRAEAHARLERRSTPFTRSHEKCAQAYEKKALDLVSYLEDILELQKQVKKTPETWYEMLSFYVE